MSGSTSRATNGKVTKVVASTMPGTAKMTLMSCSESQLPNSPCLPNSSTKISPEITGETENGRSIRARSSVRPRKRKCAISHEAASPNATLQGTAIPAVSSVSLMALLVSPSEIAAQKGAKPPSKACANTVPSGIATKVIKNSAAASVSITRQIFVILAPRSHSGAARQVGSLHSPPRRENPAPPFDRSSAPLAAPGPILERVDGEQDQERRRQHHHRDGGGARVVVLL